MDARVSLEFVSLVNMSGSVDAEWIRRELGVSILEVNERELVERAARSDQRLGVVVNDPLMYLSPLSALPANRVVILVLYDERYSRAAYDLASMPSVFRAFRTFSLNRLSPVEYIARNIIALTDLRFAAAAPKQVAAAIKSGVRIRSSAGRYLRRNGGRHRLVPIGYTTAFASAFEQMVGSVGPDDSLFDVVLGTKAEQVHERDRQIEVSFRGARGQFQRRAGVHLAAKRPGANCSSPTRSWSGLGDGLDTTSYVELLMDSRFSLCPPGYSCNESYRTYESLLCGALPVMLSSAISQGTRPAAHLENLMMGPCWTVALRRMANMSEPERRAAVRRGLAKARSAYRTAADSLRCSVRLDDGRNERR
jgi:hypothetical protein